MNRRGATTDDATMRQVLRQAVRGWGMTSPNPLVGAVLVRGKRVIGRGYHRGPGTPHAEAVAIQTVGGKARGTTLYTNLEPCCHTQKQTPPCTRLIIRHKISRVVVAMQDPNPAVNGKGFRSLRRAGIQVSEGILQEEATRLNEAYAKFVTQGKPFVVLKIAQSLDGKIATAQGESRWMTSERARTYIHKLRAGMDAVLVGIGTLLSDNPQLTARAGSSPIRQPLRVVVDSSLRTPPEAQVVCHDPRNTLIASTHLAPQGRIRKLQKQGVQVLIVKERQGRVDLSDLMRQLGQMGILSVLVEGGSALNGSCLKEGVVDKVICMLTPRIMGGQDALSAVGGSSPRHLSDMTGVTNLRVRRMGPDLVLEGYVAW